MPLSAKPALDCTLDGRGFKICYCRICDKFKVQALIVRLQSAILRFPKTHDY